MSDLAKMSRPVSIAADGPGALPRAMLVSCRVTDANTGIRRICPAAGVPSTPVTPATLTRTTPVRVPAAALAGTLSFMVTTTSVPPLTVVGFGSVTVQAELPLVGMA